MNYAYIRTSTSSIRHKNLQNDMLCGFAKEQGIEFEHIFDATGRGIINKYFKAMLAQIPSGSFLYMVSRDRLSHNDKDLNKLLAELGKKDICVRYLSSLPFNSFQNKVIK